MLTNTQLAAIRDKALAKADWYANAPRPLQDDPFYREQRARLVAEFRSIAADASFLIDAPECENSLASLEQALDAWPELDAVAAANCDAARAHLASLPADRRAQLNAEWSA